MLRWRDLRWIDMLGRVSNTVDNLEQIVRACATVEVDADGVEFDPQSVARILNTRIKDFYDIWSLSRGMEFEGAILARAIAATFARRATSLPQQTPRGLTEEFSEDTIKQALWRAFVRKGRLDVESKTLGQVIIELGAVLMPPAIAAGSGEPFRKGGAKGNG